jgi:hypothetical protein
MLGPNQILINSEHYPTLAKPHTLPCSVLWLAGPHHPASWPVELGCVHTWQLRKLAIGSLAAEAGGEEILGRACSFFSIVHSFRYPT